MYLKSKKPTRMRRLFMCDIAIHPAFLPTTLPFTNVKSGLRVLLGTSHTNAKPSWPRFCFPVGQCRSFAMWKGEHTGSCAPKHAFDPCRPVNSSGTNHKSLWNRIENVDIQMHFVDEILFACFIHHGPVSSLNKLDLNSVYWTPNILCHFAAHLQSGLPHVFSCWLPIRPI